MKEFKVTELEFKVNHQPYYIFDSAKNADKVVRLFFPYQQADLPKIESFVRRVKSICAPYLEV